MKKTLITLLILFAFTCIYSQTKNSLNTGFGYFRDIEFEGQGMGINLEYNRLIADGMFVGCDLGMGQFNNNYRYAGQLKYFGLHMSFMPIENPKFKLSFNIGPQISWYNSLHIISEHFVYNEITHEIYDYSQLYEYFSKQLWGVNFNIKSYIRLSSSLDLLLSTGFLKYQTSKNFFIANIGLNYNF